MIITIAGAAGAGKSTVASLVAGKLGFNHYSVGDFMRQIAEKRKKSLLDISRLAEKSQDIDEELDDMQTELGKTEDHFVLDSRLGWHFIPKSFKVFLDVEEQVAAERIFTDRRYGEDENTSADATLDNIKKRKASELKRYRKYYNINPYNNDNYDLVLDTTKESPDEIAEKIVEEFRKAQ